MSTRVPLARRTLFAERRRSALAVLGVAVSLLLVLMLGGIFAGAIRQVTAYLRTSGADVIVSQEAVRTMHMSSSALPEAVVDEVRAVRGVAWADPIRYATATIASSKDRQLAYVIGYRPGGHGGPRSIVAGRGPDDGEIVVDDVTARLLDVGIGQTVQVLGTEFRIAGLAANATSITNTIAFITYDDFARLRGPSVSYVLVGAEPGTAAADLRDALAAGVPAVTAQTRAEFVHEEAALVRGMSADLMRIMTAVALVIALAVIALLLFTTTLGHLRDYGVVKALGAGASRLVGVVFVQALWTAGLALATATVLAIVVAFVVTNASDNVTIVITSADVGRLGISAGVVALGGALLPLRRLLRLDPADAFRRTT